MGNSVVDAVNSQDVETTEINPGADSIPEAGNDPLAGLPDELIERISQNDPELAESRKKIIGDAPKKKNKSEESNEVADDSGVETDENTVETDDGSAEASEDDGLEGSDQPVDDDGNAIEEDSFDETVIPGFTAELAKKTPAQAMQAIAEYVEKSKASAAETDEIKQSLDKLLRDPVIASRKAMIDAGKQQYNIKPISYDEVKSVADELGLEKDEAEKLVPVIQKIVQDRALDIAQQQVIEQGRQETAKQSIAKGQSMFSAEGDLNKLLPKELQIKEKDFAKLLAEGDRHPEWKKAEKGLLKIQEFCIDRGITYFDLTNPTLPNGERNRNYMAPDVLYAAAAAAHKLPVALNTSERDKRMVGEAVKKKLAVFHKNKGDSARGLAMSASDSDTPKVSSVIDRGYDVVKLASDPSYYDKAIQKKPGDMAHFDLISKLREKGEQVIQNRGNRKRS